jgi:hypothetical protein
VDLISPNSTEFPVGGQFKTEMLCGTVANNKLASRESVTGSVWEGFRTGITVTDLIPLGVEMVLIIILVVLKQWPNNK